MFQAILHKDDAPILVTADEYREMVVTSKDNCYTLIGWDLTCPDCGRPVVPYNMYYITFSKPHFKHARNDPQAWACPQFRHEYDE